MSDQPAIIMTAPAPAGSFRAWFAAYARQHQLTPDAGQSAIAAALDKVASQMSSPAAISVSAALGKLLGGSSRRMEAQGAYVWGDVGRGKSMLVNGFYEWIPLPAAAKRRVHFHAFMREVHERMHAWRKLHEGRDMLPQVVKEIASGLRLLCLDEIQVHDVTDAMILSRLFSQLFDMGIAVIFTSNRAPEALYQSGLQRDQFEQFIMLLKQKMPILQLKGTNDYRLMQLRSLHEVYHVCTTGNGNDWLYDIYRALTMEAESTPVQLHIKGRNLLVEKAAAGIAWMTFEELCERPLGAGDYLELASEFHTLLLQDVPALGPEKRNEAKRFVTLIDALYEQKVKLICTAAALPGALYPTGDGSFEFARTASRLEEMQSEAYLAASHQKDLNERP